MATKYGKLVLLGSNHHVAPLEIREQFSLSPERLERLYSALRGDGGLDEALVLATCNRTEFYGVHTNGIHTGAIRQIVSDAGAIPEQALIEYGFEMRDLEAVRHLFEVPSGIDSQMVGETEIFGQVKQAYHDAVAIKAAGPLLNKLLQKTFQASKWIRTNTGISKGQVTIGNVAVDLAIRIFGNLKKSRTLVLGSGEVGSKTAKSLASRGSRQIVVASRTLKNAEAVATEIGGIAIPFEQALTELADYDIIISSTTSNQFVITRHAIENAMHARPGQPMFLIDLAMPRDIDPGTTEIDNTFLYNLDDLAATANENLRARENELATCREYLRARAEQFWASVKS